MKKFKLLKWYPSLPKDWKVGMVLGLEGSNPNYTCKYLPTEEVENNPEFWEEVIEKNWEILTLIDNQTKNFVSYGNIDKSLFPTRDYWAECFLRNLCWKIYSVRRISDGGIFTVGDYIKGKYGFEDITVKIKGFYIDSSGEKIVTYYKEGSNNYIFEKDYEWITVIKKKPLFTTEDGVEIFEDSDVWCVRVNIPEDASSDVRWGIYKYNGNWGDRSETNSYKWFSTKEKAEEYVYNQYPLFTTEDDVEIYKGDIYFWVSKQNWVINGPCQIFDDSFSKLDDIVTFSSEENIIDYIKDNKPVYSKKELSDILKKYNPKW